MELKAKRREPKKKSEPDYYVEHFSAMTEPGETLEGICFASWRTNPFNTKVALLGITDRRLIIQPLNRRAGLAGHEPISIRSEQLERAKLGRFGSVDPIADGLMKSTIDLKLRTREGRRHRFGVANGDGLIGAMSGASQKPGAEALLRFVGGQARGSR